MADIVTKHLSHEPVAGFPHHADTISSDREPYGPAGLRGLVASPFVLLCTACSTLGGLLFGYDQGVVSVMLVMDQFVIEFPRFDESHPRSGVAKGLLTAMIELGASVGALNQGWIANKISRRYSVLLAVAIFTVGSVLQTAVYGTRYMAGEWAWRLTFLIQMIPGFILAAGVYILPFSPRWLASKGRGKEALESLCRLRSLPVTDRRIRQELMDIQVEVRFCQEKNTGRHPRLQAGGVKDSILQELSSWANCFLKGCWRRTHVGIGLGFFQQFIGINALIYYSPTLFKTMGLDARMQLVMSGVLNVVQLIGVTTSIWTMDIVGRRKLLIVGAALMAMSHIIIAALVGIFSVSWPFYKVEGWTFVAFLMFYMLVFGASWGPIPWAMPSKVFPSSLRAKGVALSTCSNWLNNFLIGLITPPLVQGTRYGAYIFFSVFCVLAAAWTYFFVPETKGRILEQMEHVFQDNSTEEEMAKRHAIEAELIGGRYEIVHQGSVSASLSCQDHIA